MIKFVWTRENVLTSKNVLTVKVVCPRLVHTRTERQHTHINKHRGNNRRHEAFVRASFSPRPDWTAVPDRPKSSFLFNYNHNRPHWPLSFVIWTSICVFLMISFGVSSFWRIFKRARQLSHYPPLFFKERQEIIFGTERLFRLVMRHGSADANVWLRINIPWCTGRVYSPSE